MKLNSISALIGALLLASGCAGARYKPTSADVDLTRYMGTWYVWTGRTTFLETDAHNAVEKYSWNADKKRIDVDFTYRKVGPNGKLKSLPQKGWPVAGSGNAHWKLQPLWPLSFDYLVLAFDPNYEWTAVGVPDGKFLWIMGRTPDVSQEKLTGILDTVAKTGYPVGNLTRVPQEWPQPAK
jgi:apolipoprotein D and lipocalin family protein